MIDVVSGTEELLKSGKKLALARVISTWRSSPRPRGSALVVSEDGDMVGSVSGGCVENAVVVAAQEVIRTGESVVKDFGVADEDAWEVGLSCGGAISVYITPFLDEELWTRVKGYQETSEGMVLLSNLRTHEHQYLSSSSFVDSVDEVIRSARATYLSESSQVIDIGADKYFVHSFLPKKKMLLIGSAHITTELLGWAHDLGFETTVIDPRDTFAKKTSYQVEPDQLLVKWPQEVLPEFALDADTYAVILSHDPKIDDEALKLLLRSDVKYIGALGSRKTHAKRVDRLIVYGFTMQEIERIDAPIGLDIGSQTPREIALSVIAAVVKVKNTIWDYQNHRSDQ